MLKPVVPELCRGLPWQDRQRAWLGWARVTPWLSVVSKTSVYSVVKSHHLLAFTATR